MAIDADLSAGLIDDKEAQRRRRELEEESAFFGSMDGASKFVRGDAIAGLIITAINIFGGIVIGVTRHGMALARGRRRVHQAVGRRRPRHADPGADRLARRRPAGLQGRHARLGRQGGVRPARRLSARAVGGGAGDVRARPDARAAAAAVRAARRRAWPSSATSIPSGAPRCSAAEDAKARRTGERAPRTRRGNRSRNRCKTAEIELLPRQAAVGASLLDVAQRAGAPRRQDAPQVRQAIRLRRAGDQAHRRSRRSRRRPTRSRSTARVVASEELRIGDVLVHHRRRAAARRARRRGARAGLRHEGAVGLGSVRRATSSARASSRSTTCRCCSRI